MKKTTQGGKSLSLPFALLFFIFASEIVSSQVLQVKGNNTIITSGDITPSTTDFTDFGLVPQNSKFSRSFVLKNNSGTNLVFKATNNVVLSGTDPGQFSITTKPANSLTLSGNTYTILEVSYNPTSTGLKTATITIALTTGTPTSYTFRIQGTGTAAVASPFVMTQLHPNSTFNYPYALLYGPDHYLWLTERVGKKINRVHPTTGAIDQLVDMTSLVYQNGGQDGLMGMALHPELLLGTGNDYVYVAYTYGTSDLTRRTKIVRYTYTLSGSNGTLGNPVNLIIGLSGSNDHNSGKLAFGPDNKLYYSIGDQGVNQFDNKCKVSHSQDLPSQAQINTSDYSYYEGKVLRMNLDGTIPADNPVLNSVKSHVFSYGHRNAQGLTFGANGKLYSNEHGPKSDDEINIIQSGGNYGWPYISGYNDNKNYAFCNWSTAPNCTALTFSDYACGTGATSTSESSWGGSFINPITTMFTIDDGFNFTGGWLTWPTIGPSSMAIYEGYSNPIPGWNNSLLSTTLKKGRVYRSQLSPDGNTIIGAPEELFYTQNRYRDLAISPDGNTIYIITDSGGTTSGPSGSSSLAVVNPGTILVFTNTIPGIIATTSQTNVSCEDNATGTATVMASAGSGSFTYLWSPSGGTAATATGLTAGSYSCTITDSNASSLVKNFTITAPSTTTWNGLTWSNGSPTASSTAVFLANYTLNENITACALTVSNNATIVLTSGHNVTLSGAITVTAGSSFIVENNSNILQPASVLNSGKISIKRNTASLMRLDYTLWSSPVADQQLLPFSPLTVATRFYTYNPVSNFYVTVPDPTLTPFATGTGYLIRMPDNHPTAPTPWLNGTFTGTPNNGTVNLTAVNGTYNAIGNPYPSTIDADLFINANGISEALYFWRKTNSATTTAYATYTLAGGVNTNASPGPLGQTPNGIIQIGQGFIAKSTSTTLSFSNAMRVANNENQFLRTTLNKHRIWLNLTNTSGVFSQTMVAYMPNATQGIDAAIDGRYFNDSPTALTSIINNEEFAVQGRALPFDTNDSVPIGFKVQFAGNYTIALDHFDGLFASNQDIFLRDNANNTLHDLKAGSYTFASTAGVFNSRFEIRYQNALNTNLPVFNENSIVVYNQNTVLHINCGTAIIQKVKLFDLSGRLVYQKNNINTNSIAIENFNFKNQLVIVQITNQDNVTVSKKIVFE